MPPRQHIVSVHTQEPIRTFAALAHAVSGTSIGGEVNDAGNQGRLVHDIVFAEPV